MSDDSAMEDRDSSNEGGDESDSSPLPLSIVHSMNPSVFQFENFKVDAAGKEEMEITMCPYCQSEIDEKLGDHLEECPGIANGSDKEDDDDDKDDEDSQNGYAGGDGFEVKNVLSFHPTGSNTLSTYQFGCPICQKRFKFKSQLTRHIKIHTGERPYNCDVCHANFASKWHLCRHEVTHLVEQKVFFCEICLTAFSRKKNFEVHLKTHTKEKPYKCGECPSCFKLKDELVIHMQMHSGRKNPVNVSQSAPPNSVNQVHPPLPKLVPMPQLTTKSSLNLPLALPQPPETKPVVTTTVQPTPTSLKTIPISVVQPFLGPKGKKPNQPPWKLSYSCDVCGHTFSRNHHLTRHKLIHTGERPYTCGQCDSAFTRKERLTAHQQKCHTGVPLIKVNDPLAAGIRIPTLPYSNSITITPVSQIMGL